MNNLPFFSIFFLSLSSLAYEILLMRLFSLTTSHHFAYMIISLALLGYGISGTFLTIFRNYLIKYYKFIYILNILFFSIFIILSFLIVQKLFFNFEEIFWDYSKFFNLTLIYLFLSFPFFFGANAIGLTLIQAQKRVFRVYAFDLFGAGVGSLLIIVLFFYFYPIDILKIILLLGFTSLFVAIYELKIKSYILIFFATFLILFFFKYDVELKLSSYKDITQILEIKGSEPIEKQNSPLGVIEIVESELPIRYAPGLAIQSKCTLPEQLAIFIDGNWRGVIDRANINLCYLDELISALPYHILKPQSALIVNVGGGVDLFQANYFKVKEIDGVEVNGEIIDLMKNKFSNFSGNIYNLNNVNIYNLEVREFLNTTKKKYDLINLNLLNTFGVTGLNALKENYLYTIEAIKKYFSHLNENGIISISNWLKVPPRDTLKLIATTLKALNEDGITEPQKHILLIRNWQITELLIKKSQFTKEDILKVKEFVKKREFDISYYYGISKDETNQFNILSEPYFYNSTLLLVNNSKEFYSSYKYSIEPSSDDKPYFANFFKWKSFLEIFKLMDRGGVGLLEWGYLIVVLTLIQAIIFSFIFIFIPPLLSLRGVDIDFSIIKRVSFYFFLIGFGFFFLEIAFIQKFTLFLINPIYAVAISISAFLVFAGVGSFNANKLVSKYDTKVSLYIVGISIIVFSLIYIFSLNFIFETFSGDGFLIKAIITILLIAPLAFFMGMPFAIAINWLSQKNNSLIAFAWGVNGSASVIGSISATLITLHFGFSVLILLSISLYFLAIVVFSKS